MAEGAQRLVIRLKWLLDRWEKAVDSFAASPWTTLIGLIYLSVWVVMERGNIGYDGFATWIVYEIALSSRRHQNRMKVST